MSDQKVVRLFPDEETLRTLMALISFEEEERQKVTIADVTERILQNHLNRLVEIGVVQKLPGVTPSLDRYRIPEETSAEEAIELANNRINIDYRLREEALRRYARSIPVRITIEDLEDDQIEK